MSVPTLNNFTTPAAYSENSTVIFSFPKRGFAVNVTNAQIYYQLAIPGATGLSSDYTWDSQEHALLPSMSTFSDPALEGFPHATGFAGIRVRSVVAASPAIVTVI